MTMFPRRIFDEIVYGCGRQIVGIFWAGWAEGCDAVIFRQRYRNIGRLDLRLSFGTLPKYTMPEMRPSFGSCGQIFLFKMRQSFGKLPTNTSVLFLAIFRQMENRAHTDFSLMIYEFSDDD